jgi:hypothetical protein
VENYEKESGAMNKQSNKMAERKQGMRKSVMRKQRRQKVQLHCRLEQAMKAHRGQRGIRGIALLFY